MTTINRQLAVSAFSGTSMTPERRADQAIADFEGTIERLREELYKTAGADEGLRAVADAEVTRFRASYATRYSAWLHAHGRCLSVMIAGPSNFPVRRAEKANNSERRRSEELSTFRERAFKAAHRHVLDARSPEQVEDAEWTALRRRIDGDMATVAEIDAGHSYYTRSAFTTSITGRLERLARDGRVDLVRRALDYIKEKQAGWKKPFLAARNGAWKLAGVAVQQAEAPRPTGQVLIGDYGSARVFNNYDEERIQIFFDGKPAQEVRDKLNGAAWNFSRRNGDAWQRKNTNAAIWSAEQILTGSGYVKQQAEAAE